MVLKKSKWIMLGKTERLNIAGFKHRLHLYREAIHKINDDENE